jgi:hypothetical protein
MASYDESGKWQFWLAVERPAVVNRVDYYGDLVLHPRCDPFMSEAGKLKARLYNNRMLLKTRAHLALGDRRHELLRLTQTARAVDKTLPAALARCCNVWLAELEDVTALYAALGPIGHDPGAPGAQ